MNISLLLSGLFTMLFAIMWNFEEFMTIDHFPTITLYSFDIVNLGCFRQEDFFMFFPIKAYVKHVTPGARPFLAPGA